MTKRKASFTPTRNRHTLKSVRESFAGLARGIESISVDSVTAARVGHASGVSLGNVEVRCYHNGQFFLAGRFNTVIRSIVDALNS